MAQDLRSQIEETNERLTKALREGDVASVAGFYTSDAIMAPANVALVRGRDEIQALLGGVIERTGAPDLRMETQEVGEFGDTAWELGKYTRNVAGTTDVGKYIVVWKREGEVWKIHVDIWNSDLPASST